MDHRYLIQLAQGALELPLTDDARMDAPRITRMLNVWGTHDSQEVEYVLRNMASMLKINERVVGVDGDRDQCEMADRSDRYALWQWRNVVRESGWKYPKDLDARLKVRSEFLDTLVKTNPRVAKQISEAREALKASLDRGTQVGRVMKRPDGTLVLEMNS